MNRISRRALCALLALPTLVPAPAHASSGELTKLINAYRAAPATCEGRRMRPVAPLRHHAALAAIRVRTGQMLALALEQNNYLAAHVEAISVSGPQDAAGALAAATHTYCAALRSPRFVHVGISRSGNAWQIVMAEPAAPRPPPPPPLPSLDDTNLAMLAAVNSARGVARTCGRVDYGPAPRVRLNPVLAQTALKHSRDMAFHAYFSHTSLAGGGVGDRARAAGYGFARITENIAMGQQTIDEVMGSWLSSPGHCANIMDPQVTEMGAGHASDTVRNRPYWTQVFGKPR